MTYKPCKDRPNRTFVLLLFASVAAGWTWILPGFLSIAQLMTKASGSFNPRTSGDPWLGTTDLKGSSPFVKNQL